MSTHTDTTPTALQQALQQPAAASGAGPQDDDLRTDIARWSALLEYLKPSFSERSKHGLEIRLAMGDMRRAMERLDRAAAAQAAPAATPAGYLLRWLDAPDSAQWYPCERSARDAQQYASGRTEIVAISAAAPADTGEQP